MTADERLHRAKLSVVPAGLRLRAAVRFGCGNPDCTTCYEIVDQGAKDAARARLIIEQEPRI